MFQFNILLSKQMGACSQLPNFHVQLSVDLRLKRLYTLYFVRERKTCQGDIQEQKGQVEELLFSSM